MNPKDKVCAAYVRVSTMGQCTKNQEAPLREWAERMGWTIAKFYKDAGVSGSKSSRPALNQLLKDARQGRFRIVLIVKLDRMARSLSHLLWVVQELDRFGVCLKDMHSGFDMNTSTGRLTLGILGSIAQFERDLIIDRTKAGLARARSEGKHCGRPAKAFDTNSAKAMLAEGKSMGVIAAHFGVSRQTLYNRLQKG